MQPAGLARFAAIGFKKDILPRPMEPAMPRRRLPLLCLVVCMGLAACETVKGAGRDLQGAGRAVEQAASSASPS